MSQDSEAPKSLRPDKPRKKANWLMRLALIGLVLSVGGVITLGFLAKSFVDADFITAKIEQENNCRVEIGTTKISLFSFPARIELNEIKIAARDEFADAGTKLAERPKIEGSGVIYAKSVVLEADLLDILRKRISLKHLTVDTLFVSEFLIEREGGFSIDPLFDPPLIVNGQPNPEFEEKKKRRELAKQRRQQPKEQRPSGEESQFAISELPLPGTMQAFNIKDAQINAKIRRNKTRITLSNIQVKVSDIDLDPADLENHNEAKLSLTAHLDIENRDYTVKYADLEIRSEGEVIPFDPVTGYANPDLTYTITVLKGSKLEAVPSLVKLASKIKKFNEYGLKLDALSEDIILDSDTTITLGYRENALRFIEPVHIDFSGHRLTLKAGAWLHTGTNRHEASAEIFLSKAASDKALGEAREFLVKQAAQLLDRDEVLRITDKLLAPVTKNGQIWVPFSSKGDLNDPDVDPDIDYKSLGETIALEGLSELLERTQEKPTGN